MDLDHTCTLLLWAKARALASRIDTPQVKIYPSPASV